MIIKPLEICLYEKRYYKSSICFAKKWEGKSYILRISSFDTWVTNDLEPAS